MLPSLFVSHGAPTLPFDDIPARSFLKGLGATLERPRGIVIATAHWETEAPAVARVAVNGTIHDFHGFPQALYDPRYPAPDDAALIQYRTRAPHALLAHPEDGHLLPLFVAYGAGGATTRLHDSHTFGSLRMDAYGFA